MSAEQDHLEAAYEALAAAIDTAGGENEALFLTKLALILADRIADPAAFEAAIAIALEDLPGAAERH
ncbi:MAG TPA: hypothetical protein PK264_00925 [Hyphomicrobiaceae bacterium]|nr:hypothetical protein [Hyphomicrobiaceae bacterium]